LFFDRFTVIINYFIVVDLNFFGDKHGKNSRDTHFSCVSKFIRDETLVRRMTCSQDIVDAIHYRQNISNQNRILHSE